MKITKESLEKRVDNEIILSDTTYVESLLDTIHLLYSELSEQLEIEGRCLGIVLKYLGSVQKSFDSIEKDCTDDDFVLYGRCMYLYKPMIFRFYKKLRKRKVSKADCLIVIIKNMLSYLISTSQEIHHREIEELNKITTRLYDNIRNSGKTLNLAYLLETIDFYRERGLTGSYSIDKFSIEEEESKRAKTKLEGSGIRIDNCSLCKVSEVSWLDE